MSQRVSHALVTFATFVLVGPAIGSISFGLLVTAATLFADPDVGATFLFASIIFMPLAYVSGWMSAALVGAVASFTVWRTGRVDLGPPVVAAVLAGLWYALHSREDWGVAAILLIVHIAATLGCWLVLRRTQIARRA